MNDVKELDGCGTWLLDGSEKNNKTSITVLLKLKKDRVLFIDDESLIDPKNRMDYRDGFHVENYLDIATLLLNIQDKLNCKDIRNICVDGAVKHFTTN